MEIILKTPYDERELKARLSHLNASIGESTASWKPVVYTKVAAGKVIDFHEYFAKKADAQ